jgi:AbrB family looped-hinge helix DNA binding protein
VPSNKIKGIRKAKADYSASGPSLMDYRMEAIVTLDSRGQILLPKEVRQKARIKPGDKLTVVTSSPGGKLCCINLFKTEELSGTVKRLLGPMAEQI